MRVFITCRRVVLVVLVVLAVVAAPQVAAANKPEPAVKGSWRGAPSSAPVGTDVSLTLHLLAGDNAQVTAEVVPSPGIQIVGGSLPWNGTLAKNAEVNLPVSIRVVADGDWTLGVRITIYQPQGNQIASAALEVSASNGTAVFGHPPLALDAMSPEALRELGIAQEIAGPAVASAGPAVATTVSGTILWSDPEGNTHPVRGAFVEMTEGGVLRSTTSTNAAGQYTAAVNVATVRVTVYSRDFDNIRVIVFPLNQPTQRYVLQSAETPVTGAATTINITSGATTRGAPGAPANDSLSARAFAVYDGLLTYWFQVTATIGSNHQQVMANFPESTAAGARCGTSCYSGGTLQQMFILHDDAFDWDILGHEFFHFTTDRAKLRPIDSSLGGFHNFASAIGQNDGNGHIRTRDEGMRLAWSEGVATGMSLLIQANPPSPFAFPTPLLNIRDNTYSDTEDAVLTINPETPTPNDGFGSENSVMGLIWDLADTVQDADGTVTDTFAGVNAPLFWSAINTILPCNPCDRVDKMWTGLTQLFGPTSPTVFGLANLFVINKMAPITTLPADGASVPGTAAPTFTWQLNGDPAAAHRSNHVILAFSRDNFQSHIIALQPPLNATSYTPTDAEWQSVQAGGSQGQSYKWFVAAERNDAPTIPAGWFWYSDTKTIVPRSIEATITWAPVGADVDLHLGNPGGQDIAYYNKTTAWGFLDRDCISSCAQEIISVLTLPFQGSYNLFTHYYSDHDLGAATVHAVVKSGSQVLVDQTFVLGSTGATHSIISFALDTQETTSATKPSTVTSIPAMVDPARLPPKPR